MKHLHRLAVYAFVLLLSTALNIGVARAEGSWGWTETAAIVVKSDKKTKNSPQQQHEPTPSVLAVQAGPDCSITQDAGTGIYVLRATIGNATTLFSERPVRTARTMATPTFVERFEGYFNTSQPNAAITFTAEDREPEATGNKNKNNNGPLIGVLSQPSLLITTRLLEDRYTGIEYTLSQSESQAAVGSIQQFLDTSGSCSIFIDPFAVPGTFIPSVSTTAVGFV